MNKKGSVRLALKSKRKNAIPHNSLRFHRKGAEGAEKKARVFARILMRAKTQTKKLSPPIQRVAHE